jgi:hypothetical protein
VFKRDLGRQRETVAGIATCQIRDRADHPFFPQQPIGKRRDVAHVDAGTDDDATGHDT